MASSARLGRGITNRQAKYLAALQRELGERYTGNGLSAHQASLEIERLKRLLELRDQEQLAGAPGPATSAHV
jgi:hypothetical protein